MDKDEAKQTLLLYRPGTDDGEDPQMAEALTWVQRDPELAQWFDEHCEVYKAIRGKLKEIPVPADLKDTILRNEAERRGKIVHLRNILVPLAAAAVIMLVAFIAWNSLKGRDFAEVRDHVVRESQRDYGMMQSTNNTQIRAQLLGNGCPDYSLTKPLAQLATAGYMPMEWHQQKISMVCLKDAKNKPVILFVMNAAEVRNRPAAGADEFAKIHRFNSVSRVVNDKVYIVAGPQDGSELKAYLD